MYFFRISGIVSKNYRAGCAGKYYAVGKLEQSDTMDFWNFCRNVCGMFCHCHCRNAKYHTDFYQKNQSWKRSRNCHVVSGIGKNDRVIVLFLSETGEVNMPF